MIKSLIVTNHLNESITLELKSPEKSGFIVSNITGLGPSKADINSNELASTDGSYFTSSRINTRNIVVNLKFMEHPDIETVRQKTYKYFPIKKKVKLTFFTDNRTCEIEGYVESNEPTIFSKEEGTQISIVCPNPYFYSSGPDGTNVSVFYANEPLFEFEFSNESLTENLIELGNVTVEPLQTIYYSGDSDIGVKIIMKALGPVTNVSIYNTRTREKIKIDTAKLSALTGDGIIEGDEITISTIKGSKYVNLLRAGENINILNCLDKDTDWLQLSKGDNIFAYDAESGFTNLEFRIENQTIYEGV